MISKAKKRERYRDIEIERGREGDISGPIAASHLQFR
jgi:hypothetical protein